MKERSVCGQYTHMCKCYDTCEHTGNYTELSVNVRNFVTGSSFTAFSLIGERMPT